MLTTPQLQACATGTPVLSSVVNNTMHLTAEVDAAGAAATASTSSIERQAVDGVAAGSVEVFAVVAAASSATSDTGDFTKTPFSASYQWQAGASGGDSSWSYNLDMPPVPGEMDPDIALSYSSGAVDGQTAGANVRPGMIGEGWNYSAGYIERNCRACAEDTANSPYYTNATGDQCWRLPNAHLVLNGKNTELILGSDGKWRAADDDAAKVELLTGAGNGDNDGENWRVTTTDGTQYYFGRSRLPNWTTGKRETNSAWTVPVFANHSGEPCFVTTGFANSKCMQAWRWNLDYVVDRNGNSIALPSVTFGGTWFQNRADYNPNGTMADPHKYRITSVNTETGGQLVVAYSAKDTGCAFGGTFPAPASNTKRCFPQYYKPQQAPEGFSWWCSRQVTAAKRYG